MFRKTNISYLLIRTHTCKYPGVQNVSLLEGFAYLLNEESLRFFIRLKSCQIFYSRGIYIYIYIYIFTFIFICMYLNNFIFNSKNFIQTKRCAMETICAPSYTNIFMDYFVRKYIYPLIEGKSLTYFRYIDYMFLNLINSSKI